MKEGFEAFFRVVFSAVECGVYFFQLDLPPIRAKRSEERVRQSQELAIVRQKCAEQASAGARA